MRYEVHIPSTYKGKVAAAEQAVKAYHSNLSDEKITVEIDAKKFPSGSGAPRPEQPFSVLGFAGIEDAALERVEQVKDSLKDEKPKQGVRRLIIAAESGLKLSVVHLGVYDHTVTVVEDLDTGDTATGISDGVRFPLRDVIATALTPGGFTRHTVSETFTNRMAKQGVEVDKQDPYVAMGNDKPRGVYLEQSARRALAALPLESHK